MQLLMPELGKGATRGTQIEEKMPMQKPVNIVKIQRVKSSMKNLLRN